MRKAVLVVLGLLVLTACATAAPGTTRIRADQISHQEIVDQGPCSAWELVQNLRPIWLRKRGQTSFTQETDVVVYLDSTRMGYRDSLRQIDAHNIDYIEYMDARRATVRFGTGHVNGAILVHTQG